MEQDPGANHNMLYADFTHSNGTFTDNERVADSNSNDVAQPLTNVSESARGMIQSPEIEVTSNMEEASNAQTNREETRVPTTNFEELRRRQAQERETLVLGRRPLATLLYFSMAMLQYTGQTLWYIVSHKLLLLLACLIFVGWRKLNTMEGPHEQVMEEVYVYLRYASWWVGLGIASSIGLGSGLHTFVLYLGPHIAMFTLKATLCGRVDLKSAAYDTAIFGKGPIWEFKECTDFGPPLYPKAAISERFNVPLWDILQEVHWEAVLWGIGTAVGELPPYFVSRGAARMAGENLRTVEDLRPSSSSDSPNSAISGFLNKLKSCILVRFRQFNFWTILIFASVPNPLFDLAGMMCGQLNVQFWKFFIPTLIGKAVIKTHIQTVFVIALCNNQLIEQLKSSLSKLVQNIPAVSHVLNYILLQLEKSRQKYDNKLDTNKVATWKFSPSLIWNIIVWFMLLSFVISIVNATAQSYLLERHKRKIAKLEKAE